MADKIIIGKNGDEHGIWVARPGQTVQDGGPYLMSSVGDMLKIHAQGSIKSTGLNQSQGLWRHKLEVPFPELPFIPLAFMGLKTSSSEPFQFPPDLYNSIVTEFYGTGNWGYVSHLPKIGMSHKALYFVGWTDHYECHFNYTVFLLKLREKF